MWMWVYELAIEAHSQQPYHVEAESVSAAEDLDSYLDIHHSSYADASSLASQAATVAQLAV